MSAFTILIRELARHGQTTYAALLKRHTGWDFANFSQAVHKARQLGIVTPDGGKGKPIVLTAGAQCPCCGRAL